jgi:hypothetical protein
MNTQMKQALKKLNTPWKIQEFISAIPYNPDDYCRSAERVFHERKGHCFEGALLAAVALEQIGHEPQVLHLRSHRDDDHVVALFREKKLWGAVGKSNTTLLSWRPPLFRRVEDLLMSYFPFYFNTKGQMSLYAWAGPIPLKRYEKWGWRSGANDVSEMSASFYEIKGKKIISTKAIEKLPKAHPRLVDACFLGADQSGLYQV